MIKFRLYLDKDKETEWLNQMAKEGYALKSFFAGFYTFEACNPGEYIYQVDFGEKFFSITDSYREFMEETGVEIVQPWGYWIFLRKKAAEGPFVLYTDVDSQIEHYTKIRNMFKIVAIIELILFMVEIYCYYQVPAGERLPNLICTIIVGLLAFAVMKAAFKTNNLIAELKERKGESVSMKKGNVSRALLAGYLINLYALLIENPSLHTFKSVLHIFAIILMLIGLYQSSHNMKVE